MYLNNGHDHTNQCWFFHKYESCSICLLNICRQCWMNRKKYLNNHDTNIVLTFMRVKWIFNGVNGMIRTLTRNLKDISVFGFLFFLFWRGLFFFFVSLLLLFFFWLLLFVLFWFFFFFLWYAVDKSASNTVVLVFQVYSLTADILMHHYMVYIYTIYIMVYNYEYFTLNVNEAYSFELMCLQVLYLDTQY